MIKRITILCFTASVLLSGCMVEGAKSTAAVTQSPPSLITSTPSLTSEIYVSPETTKTPVDIMGIYKESFTDEFKYKGAVEETFDDRHFKLMDMPANEAEELVARFYYYEIAAQFDKLYDIYNFPNKTAKSSQYDNLKKGVYMKEYIVYSLTTLKKTEVPVEDPSFMYWVETYISRYKPTEITVVKTDMSQTWSEKASEGGPQVKDGRYNRYVLFGRDATDGGWKIYDILWGPDINP